MLVETKLFKINEPVQLESGKELPQVEIAYETYGKLNENGNNAILLLLLQVTLMLQATIKATRSRAGGMIWSVQAKLLILINIL